jgi:hypothetical protein
VDTSVLLANLSTRAGLAVVGFHIQEHRLHKTGLGIFDRRAFGQFERVIDRQGLCAYNE